jgi:parallel beta-helix repeat protein
MKTRFWPALVLVLAFTAISACTDSSGGANGGAGNGNNSGENGGGDTGGGDTGGGDTGGGDTGGGDTGGGDTGGETPEARHTIIKPGPNASEEAIAAFVSAGTGDIIEFDCGFFDIQSTLLLTHVEDITVKGCGIDKTVLSFKNNNAPEGMLVDTARGIRYSDLTVADTAGNGFEIRSADHVTLQRVRAFWSSGGGRHSADTIAEGDDYAAVMDIPCTDPPTQNPNAFENGLGDTTSPDYTPDDGAGRYGIYPVKSKNVLVEDSESIGASDAGIYVGQSSNIIIRRSRAAYNVFGFEIENVQVGMYEDNLAECNTGGFLIYDLDNLTQYGSNTIMRNNVARMNNTYNFTEGGFVGNVPPGSGMITLSYDRIDVYGNTFQDNNTGGIIHASYELFPEGAGRPSDKKIDFYTEGMRISDNTFINNGNGLPVANSEDLQSGRVAQLLPAIVGLKNLAAGDQYRGGHIIWDGLLDDVDRGCDYPKQANGEDDVPVSELTAGKPNYRAHDPEPECRYNQYKFDDTGTRIRPEWWASCIDDDNDFSSDSLTFSNFHGTKGLDAALAIAIPAADPTSLDPIAFVQTVLNALLNPDVVLDLFDFPADLDITPHKCEQEYGRNLEFLPEVVIPEFEATGEFDQGISGDPEVLCNAEVADGAVNFDAYTVDCPRLDQYHLFADAEDPRSAPNSSGVPFVMNSKLFSDYAVKYRVAYLPPGEQATYRASTTAPNVTLEFPVGTILAKTFAFLDADEEEVIETRLLIKRRTHLGAIFWAGLPYIWETDAETGERVATLQKTGGSANVSWNFTDPETGTLHAGSTAGYSIPTASQCLSCHSNKDLDGGSAPIGPKVRNMNRAYRSESTQITAQSQHEVAGQNQIKYWCDNGLLAGCPTIEVDADGVATNLPRVPKFNVPGDSGHAAGSDEDIEDRARAWLEVNCAHCHNDRGFAENTGFYLDSLRVVDTSYGICKGVTAAGAEGTNGRTVDIHPGSAADSVLEYRISQAAQDSAAARMPPIARSRTDFEAHQLITNWINNVVVADESKYPNSTACTSN